MVAAQSTCISGLVAEQSVKSGSGTANPTVVCGAPAPSTPWQAAQVARKISSPVLGGLMARLGGGAPAALLTPTRNATTGNAAARRLAAIRFGKESMITTK
jgi:hypothetical protein